MGRSQRAFFDLSEAPLSELPEALSAPRDSPQSGLASIGWSAFERMVGEAFGRRGYTVTGFGGHGPDGIDLGLMRKGERYLVLCRHWRKHQVGVTVVHDLACVIAAQRAHGGFLVTGGEFTRHARDLAQTCNIELIDGTTVDALLRAVPAPMLSSVRGKKIER